MMFAWGREMTAWQTWNYFVLQMESGGIIALRTELKHWECWEMELHPTASHSYSVAVITKTGEVKSSLVADWEVVRSL